VNEIPTRELCERVLSSKGRWSNEQLGAIIDRLAKEHLQLLNQRTASGCDRCGASLGPVTCNRCGRPT
jgi:hypothetical protein